MPKKAPIWVRKRGASLVAADASSEIAIEQLDQRYDYRIEPVVDRMGKHHRLFFRWAGLAAATIREGGMYDDADTDWFVDEIKKGTRYATVWQHSPEQARSLGALYGTEPIVFDIRRQSISWKAMDQAAFSKFFVRSMAYADEFLCPYLMDGPHKDEIETVVKKALARSA